MKAQRRNDESQDTSILYLFERWLYRVIQLGAILGITMLTVSIIVVVGDIIWRRIGGGSFIGAVDLTQLSVMFAASLSIPYAFTKGAHVKVDLLGGFMGSGMLRFLDILAALFGAALLAFLLWLTWGRAMEVWEYGDVSQDLAVPMIYYWAALIVGLALSVLACLVIAARLLLSKDTEHAG